MTNQIFSELQNDLEHWKNRFDDFCQNAHQWFDETCHQHDEEEIMIVSGHLAETVYDLTMQLKTVQDKHDDAIFILQNANKPVLADQLNRQLGKIYDLIYTLRQRAEEIFGKNPLDDSTVDTEDEAYWVYDNKKDSADQVSPFAYTSEIQGVANGTIAFLKKIVDSNRFSGNTPCVEESGVGATVKTNKPFEKATGTTNSDSEPVHCSSPDETPVTLREFMINYCFPLKVNLLESRVKSLQGLHQKKKIALNHVTPYTSGQSKKYLPSYLKSNWQSYTEKLPSLPSLR